MRSRERIGQKDTGYVLNEKMLPSTLRANREYTKLERKDRKIVLVADGNEHVAGNKLQG